MDTVKDLSGFDNQDAGVYGSEFMICGAPARSFPELGMPSRVASRLIQDEMNLDGNPSMNLASFVTTFMEPEVEELMKQGMTKNFIDIDEYSQSYELHNRCVDMIADLFHAPREPGAPGCGSACVGSSEAIFLAGLAMKWKWREWAERTGRDPSKKPNIVFGTNVQVCWHKMCRYFEIEERKASVSADCLVLTAERAKPLIDENTIGLVGILGSTFNGEFEDVKAMHDMISELNEANGWQVPIHVDAASGGFIAPFVQPDLLWDFRLPWVKSINVSGHKFGLVYAGVGWIMFREEKDLHPDLVFHVSYLGGDQSSFTLNFSRSASCIIGQYYQFVRLGKAGYKAIMENGLKNAEVLRNQLRATGKFDIVDKGHMPLVAFSLKDNSKYTVFDIQDKLHGRGWIVPAYTCPEGAEDLAIMRVVVKQNFSCDMVNLLMDDIRKTIAVFEVHPPPHEPVKLHEHQHKRARLNWNKAKLRLQSVHHLNVNGYHRTTKTTTHGVC